MLSSFPFMRLPIDLRLEIYHLLLTPQTKEPVDVIIERSKKPTSYRLELVCSLSPPIYPNTAILRACKQIYSEALPTLYRAYTFCLGDNEALLPAFLSRIPSFGRENIRRIRFVINPYVGYKKNNATFHEVVTCAQIASLAPRLREVQIQFGSLDSPVDMAKWKRWKQLLHRIDAKKTLWIDPRLNDSLRKDSSSCISIMKQRWNEFLVEDADFKTNAPQPLSEPGVFQPIPSSPPPSYREPEVDDWDLLSIGSTKLLDDWEEISNKSWTSGSDATVEIMG
ncbi:hypothetical protein M501DRAFT_1017974 [Patellaria atrata CBS 101060]|uniref:DUF7730 domain-containing protein n=1 Tax=Patellaria atrata CBS 101060 TaxID=1346257 RepID=A0A9P4VNC9_9PEZI|nr:hypothetical protein M501DRAFT_1017974 [Patellaria atrata CBS 101060]